MKKIVIITVCLAVLFSLNACVPTSSDSFNVGPDLSPNENVEFDFIQLHNDTLTFFEDHPQYQFISDLNVTGNNTDKMIYAKAVCEDDATEEVAAIFTAALLKNINDAANVQDVTVNRSDNASFGSLWDRFGIQVDIFPEYEADKENAVPLYSLNLKAGEPCDLGPDTETYENEWYRQVEIYQRNEE